MKYYIVALFDDNSNEILENLQKSLCRKFKIYKSNQKFYIPLESVENCDLHAMNNIINKLLFPYKVFKVEPKTISCRKTSAKTIDLSIEKKGYLSRLSRNINESLLLHGYNANTMEIDNKYMYIPIAKSNYNAKKYFNNDNNTYSNNQEKLLSALKIDRFEIWKSFNPRKESVIMEFPLRKY